MASLSVILAGQEWDICFGKISSGRWAVIVLCFAHVRI